MKKKSVFFKESKKENSSFLQYLFKYGCEIEKLYDSSLYNISNMENFLIKFLWVERFEWISVECKK